MSYLTLLPAYGRDYRSKAAVMADWDADKDFVEAVSAKYINRTDVLSYSPQSTVYLDGRPQSRSKTLSLSLFVPTASSTAKPSTLWRYSMICLTLIPAYGRDYKSKTAVLADWNAGKDFIESVSGKYINREDALRYSPTATIRIRYDGQREVLLVPTEKSKPG